VKKKTGLESFQDLRIAHRMADKDLPHHAARVYLWGNNSPFSHEGLSALSSSFRCILI
jgi:hypothetical protein